MSICCFIDIWVEFNYIEIERRGKNMFCLFKSVKDLVSNVTRKRMSMHVLAMMLAFMFVMLASSTDVFAMSVEGVKVETEYCTKNT